MSVVLSDSELTQLNYNITLTDKSSNNASRLASILNVNLQDPYFEKFGTKLNSPLYFNIDDENDNSEELLGALIYPRKHR